VAILEGYALTFAGVMAGTNLVPLEWTRVWQWDNFWLIYFDHFPSGRAVLHRLFVRAAPGDGLWPRLPLAPWSSPFSTEYFVGSRNLVPASACLKSDSLSQVLSLTASVPLLGALTPLIFLHSDLLSKPSGRLLLAGSAVMLLGVSLCGDAGYQR
jgi:hypothetical protein